MALEWGGYSNRLRVGINWWATSETDSAYSVSWEIWAQTDYTTYNYDVGVSWSGNASGSATQRLSNSNAKLMASGSWSFAKQPGVAGSFSLSVSGSGTGAGPASHSRTGSIPAGPLVAPAAPTSIGVTRNSDTSFSIAPQYTQSANAPVVCAEYAVQYRADGLDPSTNNGFASTTEVSHSNASAFAGYTPSAATSDWFYTLGNHAGAFTTKANRVYRWGVRNRGGGGSSPWTLTGGWCTTPAAPTAIGFDPDGKVAWTNGAAGSRNFNELEVSRDGGGWTSVSTTLGKDVNTHKLVLDDNAAYAVRVRARAQYSNTLYSGYIQTGTLYTTPAAPINVTASRAAGGDPIVKWTDAAKYANGFVIERAQDGGPFGSPVTVAAGTTQWVHTGAATGSTWQYRVAAKRDALQSPWATTGVVPVSVAPPVFVDTPLVQRCLTNGTPDADGTFLRVLGSWVIDTTGGNALQSATVAWRKKGAASDTGTSALTSGVAVTVGAGAVTLADVWQVTVTVKDTLGRSISFVSTVQRARRLLHVWVEKMRMGIGRIGNKDDTLQILLNTEIDGSLAIGPNAPADTQVFLGTSEPVIGNAANEQRARLSFNAGGGQRAGLIFADRASATAPTGVDQGVLTLWAAKVLLGAGAATPAEAKSTVPKDYCDGPAWTNFVFDSYWTAGTAGWAFPKWRNNKGVIEVIGGNVVRQTSAITLAAGATVALFAGPGAKATGGHVLIGECFNSQLVQGLGWFHSASGLHLCNFSNTAITINIGTQLYLPNFISTLT